MKPEEPERPLREKYQDLLDHIPISGGVLPEDRLGGIRHEIDATLREVQEYLEALRNLSYALGYHSALRGEDASPGGAEYRSLLTGEIKRVGAAGGEGTVADALREVKQLETEHDPALRKLRMLLTIEARLEDESSNIPWQG